MIIFSVKLSGKTLNIFWIFAGDPGAGPDHSKNLFDMDCSIFQGCIW